MTFTDDSGGGLGRHGGDPVVPGVILLHRRYDAGAGEVWAGREERRGTDVTVRYVRLPADSLLRAEAIDATRGQLTVRHPHLVAVTDVIRTPDGMAVVTEPVEGAVSLSRLLAARGRLDPGEVVTIGLPVAQALAAAHAGGLVHGELTALDILLEPNGRPLLTGVGLAALTSPGVSTPDDVHDLADLLLGAMRQATGPDAAAVAVAVAMALVDEPLRRPSAAELAAGLARSATPLPVRLTDVTPSDAGSDLGEPEGWGGLADRADDLLVDAVPVGTDPDPDTEAEGDPWATGPEWLGERQRAASASGLDAPDLAEMLEPAGPDHQPGGWGGDAAWDEPPGDHTDYTGRGPAPAAEAADPIVGEIVAESTRPSDGRTAPSDPSELVGSLRPATRDRRNRGVRSGARSSSGRGTGRPSRPARGTARGRAGGRGGGKRGGGWRRRLLLPAVGLVGLMAVVVAVALMSGGSDRAETTPVATGGGAVERESTATPVSGRTPEQVWRGVLTELNAARSVAFETADLAALDKADAPNSAVLGEDQKFVRVMQSRGGRSTPIRIEIIDLAIRSERSDQVVLRVTEKVDAYQYVDANGRVLGSEPGRAPVTKDLTLWLTEGGWRLAGSEKVTAG